MLLTQQFIPTKNFDESADITAAGLLTKCITPPQVFESLIHAKSLR